ncbi:MAG: dihydroorotase [Lachnospiraceae bacterium]|nr:dihydroorotase [Lachnospiraceae bacterium]
MLLIKNSYRIDPRSGQEGICDILVDGGKVARIGDSGTWQDTAAAPVYDAGGLIAAPGLVDVHVHFRDPGFTYKEDIESGGRAAARGGFTTVVLMANTKPVVDNVQTLSYVLEKGKKTGIHVESCCAVTEGLKGEKLTNMSELMQSGAAGFTDDGIPLLDETIVRRAMKQAAELGTVLSFHEENPAYIVNNGIHAGAASAHYGIGGSPREAEISMVERDVRLALETGAAVNFQHISTKEAVALIREAKKRGTNIHAEATPHHFTLNEEAAIQFGTLAKMNPPLREEADRLAIIEGLCDGSVDLIATDHAPHSSEEKERPITEAPSGIIGLETALALGITSLVEPGYLTMMELLRKMTWNPASLYHFDRGYLAEGGPADIVLFDPKQKHVLREFASKSSNTPFAGMELTGKVVCTICQGKVVYQA